MKDFLSFLLSGIVEHEDKVGVKISTEDDFLKAEISVHPDDIGRVIGKEGKVIRAIRSLARAKAALDNQKVRVEILEEGEEKD